MTRFIVVLLGALAFTTGVAMADTTAKGDRLQVNYTGADRLTDVGGVQAAASTQPRTRKCYEAIGNVFKLSVYGRYPCSLARRAMRKWFLPRCPWDGTCHFRLGRDGNLWECHSSRARLALNPYYVACWASRDDYNPDTISFTVRRRR